MNQTKYYYLKIIFLTLIIINIQAQLLQNDIFSISKQLAENIYALKYSMNTEQGYNMDCLKILNFKNQIKIGIFHSSKGYNDHYNRLYSTFYKPSTQTWEIGSKISQRGSQGTIFQLQNGSKQSSLLIAYELQNHEHGNTYALRYYENYQHLISNNFLYQYQLQQKIDLSRVKNIGTPSIQSLRLIKQQNQTKYNEYQLSIKFHYSPDGQHDIPGFGIINIKPLRDFTDKYNKWRGGCKQNYTDWKGNTDTNVLNAIRKLGVTGKIGQRDYFDIFIKETATRYYLYEVNLYSDFNWINWRIFLYSQGKAYPIQFVFDKVFDIANPHVTIESINQSVITLQLSFFLPSEGMQPFSDARPGQMIAKTKLNLLQSNIFLI